MEKERKQVTITEVRDPKSGTSKKGKPFTVYYFRAKNGDDKDLTYQTMSTTIGEAIKDGLVCEIEFEVKEREWEGNTYIDRNVSQMWINGEPVRSSNEKGNYSPKNQKGIGISNANNAISNIIAGGYIEVVPKDIVDSFWNQIRKAYSDIPEAKKQASDTKEAPKGRFSNAGEFMDRCQKEFPGYKIGDIYGILGVTAANQIKNFEESYESVKLAWEIFKKKGE